MREAIRLKLMKLQARELTGLSEPLANQVRKLQERLDNEKANRTIELKKERKRRNREQVLQERFRLLREKMERKGLKEERGEIVKPKLSVEEKRKAKELVRNLGIALRNLNK